jgi:hypothetical protein
MHRRTYAAEPSDLVGQAANRVVMRRDPSQPIDGGVPFTAPGPSMIAIVAIYQPKWRKVHAAIENVTPRPPGSVAMAVVGDWIVISSLRRPVEAQSHQKVTHEMFDRWDDRIVELGPAGQG